MIKRMKAKGFTLTEIVICMGIMLLVVYLSMDFHIGDQTAKQEAERLEIWLTRIFQQAIRMRRGFTMYNQTTSIRVIWGNKNPDSIFKATSGCTFSDETGNGTFSFSSVTNGFGTTNATIKVTGQDGSKYYIKFSKTGRIRLTEDKDG